MSQMGNVTDSIPSPPRVEEPHDDDDNDPVKDDDHTETSDNQQRQNGNSSNSHRDVYIQINGAKRIHFGHNVCIYPPTQGPTLPVVETPEIVRLKKSKDPVTDDDINKVYRHIGERYRETFRLLGFSDGEIGQQKLSYHDDIPGMIHKLLSLWKQRNGRQGAIKGVLAHALWTTGQQQAVKKWTE